MKFCNKNNQQWKIGKILFWGLAIFFLVLFSWWIKWNIQVFAYEDNIVKTAQENKTISDAEAESAKEKKEGDTLAKMNAVNSMSADNQKMLEKAGNLMSMGTKYLMMPALAVLG